MVIRNRVGIEMGELKLATIEHGRTRLKLKKPLVVQTKLDKGWYFMSVDELNIIGTHRRYRECLKEVHDQFLFVYRQYGLSEDHLLSTGAQELKRKVLAYVN